MSDSTKSEHTPGPWFTSQDGGFISSAQVPIATPYEIKDADGNTNWDEVDANACLIAAAPEMFKELLWMAAQYDDSQTATTLAGRLYDVSATAKKLIALARGES